ncbi:MAG: pyruvate dehydrogenase complex dihydrolipoamide acetyltransferase [Bacteroidetes bacterium]|nr:pyruvate dehydrogenase complex dihydrolipoamide acetyltransferase [Bacteroidota bacterium]
MAEIVRMPKLSDTMTDGVVAKWHKKVGDTVKEGDLLADIETDKATMEFESFVGGTLLYVGVPEQGTAPVDAILAIFGKKGEDISGLIVDKPVVAAVKPVEKAVVAEVVSTPEPVVASKENNAPAPKPQSSIQTLTQNSKIFASPLAQKMAKERNINLSKVKGSGDNGRITKADIENYDGSSPSSNFVGVEKYTEVPVSQMRKTIARRLAESKFSAPHFYLTIEMDMDNAINARNSINAIEGVKISFNDLIIKAVAGALKKHPKVNTSWLGDKIRFNEHINIGVAVAVEEGLLVPVVRFADGKTLTQISDEVRNYALLAKDKKLQPQDWEGSTFTISNLGMFGIEEFTAIINPPDACIMAIGGIKQVPVVKNGQIVPGNTMKVTLSCDHRVVDGATGAAFLQTFKNYMENPVVLLGIQSI